MAYLFCECRRRCRATLGIGKLVAEANRLCGELRHPCRQRRPFVIVIAVGCGALHCVVLHRRRLSDRRRLQRCHRRRQLLALGRPGAAFRLAVGVTRRNRRLGSVQRGLGFAQLEAKLAEFVLRRLEARVGLGLGLPKIGTDNK